MPVPILEPTHRSSNRKNMAHEASTVSPDSVGFQRGARKCNIKPASSHGEYLSASSLAHLRLLTWSWITSRCCPNMSSFRANTKTPATGEHLSHLPAHRDSTVASAHTRRLLPCKLGVRHKTRCHWHAYHPTLVSRQGRAEKNLRLWTQREESRALRSRDSELD